MRWHVHDSGAIAGSPSPPIRCGHRRRSTESARAPLPPDTICPLFPRTGKADPVEWQSRLRPRRKRPLARDRRYQAEPRLTPPPNVALHPSSDRYWPSPQVGLLLPSPAPHQPDRDSHRAQPCSDATSRPCDAPRRHHHLHWHRSRDR